MRTQSAFEYEDGEVRRYLDKNLAILKLRGNVFGGMTDLESIEEQFFHYDLLGQKDNIRGFLMLNEHGIFGETAYREFLTEVSGKDVVTHRMESILDFDKWIFRAREVRILQRLIVKMLDFRKLCIMGLQGTVVTPFFGLSLAADFRFASEDMCFSLSHTKYGLQPTGALPFFLPRHIGCSKAADLLFKGGEIPAEQALELGLIHEILPTEDFEKHCVEKAQNLCNEVDVRIMETTKHLLYYYKNELHEYFTKEADFIELKGSFA